MYSIKRNIEDVIKQRSANNKAILLTGPRQVGKSTLFKHLFSNVNYVTFDDDILLMQASEDPQMFLYNNPCPLIIDEVQKCPSIFNRIKIILDNTDSMSNFYLTGSQKLQLIEGISESLAGRVSIIELEGLSMREINNISFNKHFIPSKDYILEREKQFSTGIGNGIAMPHCRCDAVNEIEIIICTLDESVDWNSIDNKPVDFVIALAIPNKNINHEYLSIISKLARALMDESYINELKSFKDETDIIKKIKSTIK